MSIFSLQTQVYEGETAYFDIDLSAFGQPGASRQYRPGDEVEVKAVGNVGGANATDFRNFQDVDSSGAPIWRVTLDDNLRATLPVETLQNDVDLEHFTFVLDDEFSQEIALIPGGFSAPSAPSAPPLPVSEVTNVEYNTESGQLEITGTGFEAVDGEDDIIANWAYFTNESGEVWHLPEGASGEIASDTSIVLTMPETARAELETFFADPKEDITATIIRPFFVGSKLDTYDVESSVNVSYSLPVDPPTFTFTQNITSIGESETSADSFGSIAVEGGEGVYSFTYNLQIGDGEVISVPEALTVNADGTTNIESATGMPVDGDQDVKIWFTPEFENDGATYQSNGFSESSSMTLVILDTDGSGNPVVEPPSNDDGGGGGGGGGDDYRADQIDLSSLTPQPERPADQIDLGDVDLTGLDIEAAPMVEAEPFWMVPLSEKTSDFDESLFELVEDPDFIDSRGRKVKGTGDDDFITGNKKDNLVVGRNGDDFLRGGKGDDRIKAGNGNDFILDGRGDDLIIDGGGDDFIVLGSGDDVVKLGSGDNIIVGFDSSEDVLKAKGGIEWMSTDEGMFGTYDAGTVALF